MKRIALVLLMVPVAAACQAGPTEILAPTHEAHEAAVSALVAAGMQRVTFPDPDPGMPAYARMTTLLDQLFHDDGWLAIPFYRDPACIPEDFNLLGLFHPPGPDGIGAFECQPLTTHGFYLVEADAPMGTFPRVAFSSGDAVPFWFVDWDEFQAALGTGRVTIGDLAAMTRLEGVATSYRETLRPRPGEHLVVIDARGRLADGRAFQFHITHVEDQTRAVRVRFR
jgi:hypothetical protein